MSKEAKERNLIYACRMGIITFKEFLRLMEKL